MHRFDGWKLTIGLEVHIQLLTQSKLFSGASTAYGAPPNAQVSPIDLGMPGTLPVLNQEAVRMAILFGLSINANIPKTTVFARKHYFYPDLPKGYQISQHHHPIVGDGGVITIDDKGVSKPIRITRAHLEEDAGKSVHTVFKSKEHATMTGIDLNRAGVPLLEIVTAPDLCSAREAVYFLKKLHRLVRYLKICDGNMQEGSFRCDANVSVRRDSDTTLGVRAELKNLNSFKYLEDAINIEASRQIQAIMEGKTLQLETRSFDPSRQQTLSLRKKEVETDYRYIPDPDLCPLPLAKESIETIANQLPELPEAKRARFKQQYQLVDYDVDLLVATTEQADYFESVVAEGIAPKLAANWMNGELAASLNAANLDIHASPVTPVKLADLLKQLATGCVSRATAKLIFDALWTGLTDIESFIQTQGLAQLSDHDSIQTLIHAVLSENPKQVAAYRDGKLKLFGFFIGQVMQRSEGRCDPAVLNQLLKRSLDNISRVTEEQ